MNMTSSLDSSYFNAGVSFLSSSFIAMISVKAKDSSSSNVTDSNYEY
jgi:hypothetical protein